MHLVPAYIIMFHELTYCIQGYEDVSDNAQYSENDKNQAPRQHMEAETKWSTSRKCTKISCLWLETVISLFKLH